MKIVFVETPSPWLVRRDMHIPLGPLYLATILKREGHDVKMVRPQKVEDLSGMINVDIICLSGTSLEYPMNVECALWIKLFYPMIKIFLGGSHATAMNGNISRSVLFDKICVGEGEATILEMIKDVERKGIGQFYFSNGLNEDLDTIPFPDRSLIEGDYGNNIFVNRKSYNNKGSESIITSRGCSYNCAFCATHAMWNGKTRYRSIHNIVSEIKQIIKSTGRKQFAFWDDNLTINKKRCLVLCDELKELDIIWRCLVRADQLDSETCEALVAAGCKEIWPGIESGDQRVLDYLNKRTDAELMLYGCKNARKAGLKIKALFMIGTPGERANTPEINREYMNQLDFDMITLSTFTPLPGSPIWTDPEKYNCEILNTDFSKYNQYSYVKNNGKKVKREYEPMIHNKFLTIDEMKSNVERMNVYVEETGRHNKG